MKEIGVAKSVALVGLESYIIDVQSSITHGLPNFSIVGLPDISLKEARPRVRSAISRTGITWPLGLVIINLSPAAIPKQGSSFDLAIAISILAAGKHIKQELLENVVFISELGLDGSLLGVRGVLPTVSAAKKAGYKKVVVSIENEEEARLVEDIEIIPLSHLTQVINRFGGSVTEQKGKFQSKIGDSKKKTNYLSLDDIKGQWQAKHALEIMAAGGHHGLFVGPPGTGKSMLAQRIPYILPKLDKKQSLEVTNIHSIAGITSIKSLVETAPFVAPHHTATTASITGGGTGFPKPGAISKAHRGILFLDEAPEFSPRVLQTLRQPLETGEITIDRANASIRYPATFQLVLAANPCPCGNFTKDGEKCTCTTLNRVRYFSRLSGPLLDRVDIQVFVDKIGISDLENDEIEEDQKHVNIVRRIKLAKEIAMERLKNTPWNTNAETPGTWIRKEIKIDKKVSGKLYDYYDKGFISLRGLDKVYKIAWTISDLKGQNSPKEDDIYEALSLRPVANA